MPSTVRTLAHRPDLDQIRRQAKELLRAFVSGDADAAADVNAHYRGASASAFALHDAQLVIARSYGFESWPKLKAYVDGATIRRLVDAISAHDERAVRTMLAARPELARVDTAESDERQALHHAVLQRQPEIVRLLMQNGADPYKGVWPHRDATSPMVLAFDRGYEEIAAIMREGGARREDAPDAPEPRATAATIAAQREIARGGAAALRAQHAASGLPNDAGLVSYAVESGRLDMLALLLELGLDPDERGRVRGLEEHVPTWGEPLRACAINGNLAMAECLLAHGADPNTNVYAASSAVYEAYARQNSAMVALLEGHGGSVNAIAAGVLGRIDRARQMLDADATGASAEALLDGAADNGHIDIVRLALERIDWPKGDERWHWMLMRPLGGRTDSERERFLACFRAIADRSGGDPLDRFGRTILHDIAGAWPRSGPMGPKERLAFATILLDRGARLDVRDSLLLSTPLGWACRWGRTELVSLLLDRGADPVEADAEPWATPLAWAERMRHSDVLHLLRTASGEKA